MGTSLRNFKNKMWRTLFSDEKTLGGKGRQTHSAINDRPMQLYYGLAIRRNVSSCYNVTTVIWAEFYHLMSSNDRPAHGMCPRTPDTWCKFVKAQKTNEEYDHTLHNHVEPVVMLEIKYIFTWKNSKSKRIPKQYNLV